MRTCSRKVRGVDPVLVVAAKNSRNSHGARKLLAERSPRATSTRTSVTILSVSDLVGVGCGARPNGPALRVNNVTQSGILEDNARVVPPRTAKVVATGLHGAAGSRDARLVDDIVGWVGVGVATVGGNPACRGGNNFDVDAVKPGSGFLAEDEVGSSVVMSVDSH